MSVCPAHIREQIERDIREEARGRDAADMHIPARIAAGMRREAILQNRPERPIRRPEGAGIAPDLEGEASDGFDRFHAAEGDFLSVCHNQMGRFVPDSVYETLRERRDEMDAQTRFIADALDKTGRFEGRFNRGEKDPSRCSVIGLYSGEVINLPSVRRVAFFPSIAAGNRSKMLRDIEHFINGFVGNARLYTITNGPRVPIHRVTLREETQKFHRWLSKMAADKEFKRFGIRMQWRATEFGRPKWEHDPESGMDQMTLHLHAHCLVTEPENMTGKQRARMRKKLWKLFGVHWDDGGTIENVREFVKYPAPPEDLERIAVEGGPGMLADFYEAIRGLHIVQPMGDLRRIRGQRRANARRITVFSRDNGRSLEETGDWNAGKRPFAGRKPHREEYKKQAKELAIKMAQSPVSYAETPDCGETPAETPGESGDSGEDDARPGGDEPKGTKSPPPRNRIIARLAPAPYGSAINEPAVVVWGFDGNVAAVLSQRAAVAIRERHEAAYIRACADAQRARARQDQSSQRSNNCPDPLGDLALVDAQNDPPGAWAAPNFWNS